MSHIRSQKAEQLVDGKCEVQSKVRQLQEEFGFQNVSGMQQYTRQITSFRPHFLPYKMHFLDRIGLCSRRLSLEYIKCSINAGCY